MEQIIAHDQRVMNQFAYANFYRGTPVQIMRAVERELTENPGKPQLEYLSVETLPGIFQQTDQQQAEGHAKFILPGHMKYQ